MLQNVAMPDITPRESVEAHDNARDHFRMRPDGIFPAVLEWLWWNHRSRVSNLPRSKIERFIKASPVEQLEPHHMKMNGMRVLRRVHEFPDFGSIDHRIFCNRHIPMLAAQQHSH